MSYIENVANYFEFLANAQAVWSPRDYADDEGHRVIFNNGSDQFADGQIEAADPHMLYPATWFVGLKRDEPVAIDRITYLVRQVRALDDGKLMRAELYVDG